MRILTLAALIALASCAGHTTTSSLDARLASWQGSSIDSLSAELGDPTSRSADWVEWKFTSRGMSATRGSGSLGRVTNQRCSGCDPNPASSAGYQTQSGITSGMSSSGGSSSGPRRECVYRAYIDGSVIVRIDATANSGRCRFRELPVNDQP